MGCDMNFKNLTIDKINFFFSYDGENLLWKNITSRRCKVNSIAGTEINGGYRHIRIEKTYYLAHQIIFFMAYRYVPEMVDHIDGNKRNNKINNLRAATRSQNGGNSKIRKDNFYGLKGVTYHKQTGKFRARITCNKKKYSLGLYKTKDDAAFAYSIAASFLFKEFARF